MTTHLWKSGDRKTVWTKTLQKTHPDGTVETWTVEKVSVRDPKTQQLTHRQGIVYVVSASRQLYSKKTMALVHYTSYYSFSQSFHGGLGSAKDALGGFASGRYYEYLDESKYRESMRKLKAWGFREKPVRNPVTAREPSLSRIISRIVRTPLGQVTEDQIAQRMEFWEKYDPITSTKVPKSVRQKMAERGYII